MKILKRLSVTFLSGIMALYSLCLPVMADGIYTVKEGDNLSKISTMSYGVSSDWRKIYNQNKDKIADPNLISVGVQLIIPDQITVAQFYELDGKQAYHLVKNSSDSWVVESYDLITPDNIKETAVVSVGDNGLLKFNLAWPPYGGYEVYTINSIGDTSGITNISRIGGNGGHSICFGNNPDGSEFTASQRSIPSSSITYRSGIMNIDLYKSAVNAITSAKTDADAIIALEKLGFSSENAEKLISDYAGFFKRSEMAGDKNILDGIKLTGRTVDSKYGFYGLAAPWKTSNLDLEGGSTQMTTVFSFGTMISSGIIADVKEIKG